MLDAQREHILYTRTLTSFLDVAMLDAQLHLDYIRIVHVFQCHCVRRRAVLRFFALYPSESSKMSNAELLRPTERLNAAR